MLAREPLPHGRVISGAFQPHPLLAHAHLQTLFPALLRTMPALDLRVERWERPDGDFVNLAWVSGPRFASAARGDHDRRGASARAGVSDNDEARQPLVILLHGLTGGFDSKYLRGLACALLARNWRAVVLEFRGAGLEPNRLPRSYHQGDTADLRDLILRLRESEPGAKLFVVGWSLGGNVLLKYLGEDGAGAPLAGAVAVCAPFSLHECAEKLRTGFARIYQHRMLRELKRNLRRKAAAMALPMDVARALAARDFFEYDEAATAPLNGFKSAEDYYARCSNAQFLHAIRAPTLIVHASDDPFMTPAIIPDAAGLGPQVTLELCARGGHVGFVAAGASGLPAYWLEQRIPQFLESLCHPERTRGIWPDSSLRSE